MCGGGGGGGGRVASRHVTSRRVASRARHVTSRRCATRAPPRALPPPVPLLHSTPTPPRACAAAAAVASRRVASRHARATHASRVTRHVTSHRCATSHTYEPYITNPLTKPRAKAIWRDFEQKFGAAVVEKELPATTKNKGKVMNYIRRAKKGPGAEAREEASVGKLIRCSIATCTLAVTHRVPFRRRRGEVGRRTWRILTRTWRILTREVLREGNYASPGDFKEIVRDKSQWHGIIVIDYKVLPPDVADDVRSNDSRCNDKDDDDYAGAEVFACNHGGSGGSSSGGGPSSGGGGGSSGGGSSSGGGGGSSGDSGGGRRGKSTSKSTSSVFFVVRTTVHLLLNLALARAREMDLGLMALLDGTGRITMEKHPLLFMGVVDIGQHFHLTGSAVVNSENRQMARRFIEVQLEYLGIIMSELEAASADFEPDGGDFKPDGDDADGDLGRSAPFDDDGDDADAFVVRSVNASSSSCGCRLGRHRVRARGDLRAPRENPQLRLSAVPPSS